VAFIGAIGQCAKLLVYLAYVGRQTFLSTLDHQGRKLNMMETLAQSARALFQLLAFQTGTRWVSFALAPKRVGGGKAHDPIHG